MSTSIDHVLPKEKWTFDNDVTNVFDNMLARSIPQYAVMRDTCTQIAKQYVKPMTDIVDLGCSRGEAIAPLVDAFGAHNRFLGIEVSEPMLQAAQTRFRNYEAAGIVRIRKMDLRTEYPKVNASVTMCVLTLQFTPIEYRQRILRDIYQSTISGGALILIEKVLGATVDLDEIMIKSYYAMKETNGYSREEIERKRLSLEGVLVPVTARWNEELLRTTGFTQIDCFWRWMNFAGWIAVK